MSEFLTLFLLILGIGISMGLFIGICYGFCKFLNIYLTREPMSSRENITPTSSGEFIV